MGKREQSLWPAFLLKISEQTFDVWQSESQSQILSGPTPVVSPYEAPLPSSALTSGPVPLLLARKLQTWHSALLPLAYFYHQHRTPETGGASTEPPGNK